MSMLPPRNTCGERCCCGSLSGEVMTRALTSSECAGAETIPIRRSAIHAIGVTELNSMAPSSSPGLAAPYRVQLAVKVPEGS